MKFTATTTFGLEAIVKREIMSLGFENVSVLDGRVDFTAKLDAIPIANLNLRSADRLLLNMSEFEAYSFEELFQNTKALPWAEIIPEDGNFIVTGKSIKSQLHSVPDCQSIVEKAIVESLKEKYKIDWFSKSGPIYKIQVAILKDIVTLSIDTTGAGLHKRGYRENSVTAPIKETLASALIDLSFWKRDRILLDPLCGSGTIAIEAAMVAKNIAPGLSRRFVSEDWSILPAKLWKNARAEAYAKIDTNFSAEIFASDLDDKAIEVAKHNARLAGVDDCINFTCEEFKNVTLPSDYGVCITNPPYGERIGNINEIEELYKDMGKLFNSNRTWSVYVITSYEGFEKLYGRKADKKRKLFNGMIKTDYYQFYGDRPPRAHV